MPTITRTELDETLERLRVWLAPGDTVYTILRHVSRSGVQRVIQCVKLRDDGPPLHIGSNVAKVIGARYDSRREGVVMGGCGMDMGFALVYELSRALWPDSVPCTGTACLSNDHHNDSRGPRGAGVTHQDGGCALKQVWL